MNYYEAKEKINKIKESTADFQKSINKVQTDLVNKISDLKKINGKILIDINQSDIVSYSERDINCIEKSINNALTISARILSILSKDATTEIERIVNSYNN